MKNKQLPSLLRILNNPDFNQGTHWCIKNYTAGQTILNQGDNTSCLYLILNGRVRVLANIELNKNKNIHPGFSDLIQYDVFGELSLINQQPHATNIAAVSPCEIAVITNKHLEKFLDLHPKHGIAFYKEIAKILADRLDSTNTKAFSLLAWGLNQHGIDKHLD